MNNNFNANQLLSTISILDGDLAEGMKRYSEIGNGFANIAEIVQSEDSNLFNTMNNTFSVIREIYNKMEAVSNSIKVEMQRYADETIANELEAAQGLESIISSLESIDAQLNAI